MSSLWALAKVMKDKCVDYVGWTEPEGEAPKEQEQAREKAPMVRTYEYDTPGAIKTFFMAPTEMFPGPFLQLDGESPRIYLGSGYNAANRSTLAAHGIRYIVNVTAELGDYFPTEYKYFRLPIRDNNNDDITEHLQTGRKILQTCVGNRDGNILIHCYMGASRSATVLAYYLCSVTGLDPVTVIKRMKEHRKNVNPTQRFMTDLRRATLNLTH